MPNARSQRENDPENTLGTYLRDINRIDLLSAHEEKTLGMKRTQEARDKMVNANLRFVVTIARKFTGKGLGLQDLIAEGNFGLFEAVKRFDPEKFNTRFTSYAAYWIEQCIKRAIINTAKTVRVPAYMVEIMGKWGQAASALEKEIGRLPTDDEVGIYLGIPEKKMKLVRRAKRIMAKAPQPDEDFPLEELAFDGYGDIAGEALDEQEEMTMAIELLHALDERERKIMRMRFGLDDNDSPRTLKEIGEDIGLTRERVRQIEEETLEKLGKKMGVDRDRTAEKNVVHETFPAPAVIAKPSNKEFTRKERQRIVGRYRKCGGRNRELRALAHNVGLPIGIIQEWLDEFPEEPAAMAAAPIPQQQETPVKSIPLNGHAAGPSIEEQERLLAEYVRCNTVEDLDRLEKASGRSIKTIRQWWTNKQKRDAVLKRLTAQRKRKAHAPPSSAAAAG